MVLNDLALSYAKLGKLDKAREILAQSFLIASTFEKIELKVREMTNIASHYQKIGQTDESLKILENTINLVNSIEENLLQGQLLLHLSFKYEELGQKEKAKSLLSQSQTLISKASQPLSDFPFQETPTQFKLGFTGNVTSFRDTTGFFGTNIDYSKQWSEDDIFVEGQLSFSFDSSRTVNNYRPQSFLVAVYRNHFNADWNFFITFFNSVNENRFSSRNDDEDLTVISGLWFGPSLNLWQGGSNQKFLDLQIGMGPRYEYDYIDFETRKNEVNPTLGIILMGKGFSLGKVTMDQKFGFVPALDDFNEYVINSNSKISFSLTERWSFVNRLFVRYRNQRILEENPKVNFFFSTGLEYNF
ncbi:MAG: tetratricopeptide repeat protein [Crocosphaera sp.]